MKRVWVIIVEGKSEKHSLEGILINLLANNTNTIQVFTYGADLLSCNYPITSMLDKIKAELAKQKLKLTDVEKIIQLSDLDGCYINDESVIEDNSTKITYRENDVICKDRVQVIKRNEQKRINITLLTNKTKIVEKNHHMNYEIYFFGCNLDHVLHDNRNLSDKYKVERAKKFALDYEGRELDFIEYAKSLANEKSKEEYLDWIKSDNNSLKKSSNIYYLIKKE